MKLRFKNKWRTTICKPDPPLSKRIVIISFLVISTLLVASLSQSYYRSNIAFGLELPTEETTRDLDHIPNTLGIKPISVSPASEEQLAQSYMSRGDSLYQAGRCNESLDALNQGIAIDPESDFGYNSLGNTLDCLGRYEEALSAYDRALEILNRTSPQDFESLAIYYTNKGSTLDNLGRYEEALQVYDQAISLDPEYLDVHINKGVSLSNLGRYEEAIKEDEIAISIDPDDPLAYYNKALDLSSLERNEEALQAYDQLLSVDPNYVDAYTGKGDVLTQLGRHDEALVEYDKAISIGSGNATDTTVASSGKMTGAGLPDRTNQTSSTLTYENYGTRLQYPSDWKQQQNLRPVFDTLFIPPGENESLSRIGIGFKTVNIPSTVFSFDQDPDVICTAIDEMAPIVLSSIIPDFLLTGSERSTLAGMPACEIRFIGQIGENVLAVQSTILIHEGKLVILSYFAPPEVFAKHLLAANNVSDSFELVE